MRVSDAVERRVSTRAFLDTPIPAKEIRELLIAASRAPSGGNLQPWRVHALTGEPLAELKQYAIAHPEGEQSEYAVYPENLWEPLRSRRYQCGEDLYAAIGIAREDREGRRRQFANNARLFGAPVGFFFAIDRRCGPPQWSDVGMFMQTLMLLALERGIDSCAQEFWARYPRTVSRIAAIPDTHILFSGMAMGYRDPAHPINRLRTQRDPLADWGEMRGFGELIDKP